MNRNGFASLSVLAPFILGVLAGIILLHSLNKNKTELNFTRETQNIPEQKEALPISSVEPKQNIEENISYEIPNNWRKDIPTYTSNSFSLKSPGLELTPANVIRRGAWISVERFPKRHYNLWEEVVGYMPVPFQELTQPFPIVIKPIQIGNLTGLNEFSCWEGCTDSYFILKDNYLWRFIFFCGPNCSTKEIVDANVYADDRDAFLASIKFK